LALVATFAYYAEKITDLGEQTYCILCKCSYQSQLRINSL